MSVLTLIEQGANIDKEDGNGWTPLYFACYKGHLSIVKYLVEKRSKYR